MTPDKEHNALAVRDELIAKSWSSARYGRGKKARKDHVTARAADLIETLLSALQAAERERDEAVRLLSRIDRVYGDIQDGNGNTPTEIRKVQAFLARSVLTEEKGG